MANFTSATEAVAKALSIVDGQLATVDASSELDLYLELIYKRAVIQQAKGV